jgi:hypothetical protein
VRSAHSVSVCSVRFSQQTATVSPHNLNRLGSVVETWCVSCEVRSAHSVSVCSVRFSQQTATVYVYHVEIEPHICSNCWSHRNACRLPQTRRPLGALSSCPNATVIMKALLLRSACPASLRLMAMLSYMQIVFVNVTCCTNSRRISTETALNMASGTNMIRHLSETYQPVAISRVHEIVAVLNIIDGRVCRCGMCRGVDGDKARGRSNETLDIQCCQM